MLRGEQKLLSSSTYVAHAWLSHGEVLGSKAIRVDGCFEFRRNSGKIQIHIIVQSLLDVITTYETSDWSETPLLGRP